MSSDDSADAQAVRAEGRLRKAEQVERDKRAVWSELEADKARVDANTARLKALRIAKEQSEATLSASADKPAKSPAKRRKPAPR